MSGFAQNAECRDEEETRDGVDGWELVDYVWDETTGTAICLYEREVYGMREEREVHRQQPASPKHAGWSFGRL